MRFAAIFCLLCLIGVLGACAGQPRVDAYLVDLTPAESTALEQRLKVKVRLQNAGERAVRAKGLDVRLDVNGQRFATGVSSAAFTVLPLEETTTEVTLSISIVSMIRQVLNLAQTQTVRYTLRGTVHGDGLRNYRFRKDGQFSPQSLDTIRQLAPG